jgi:hypothetical protein
MEREESVRERKCFCVLCKRMEVMEGGRGERRWDTILPLRSTLMTPPKYFEGDHTKQSKVSVA